MKKTFFAVFLAIFSLVFLFSCENDGQNSEKTTNASELSSSPFEEATELKDGFETPIMPND